MPQEETKNELLADLKLQESNLSGKALELLTAGDTKYLKDLRVNLKNALFTENLRPKEAYLTALSIAVNERNNALISSFSKLAEENGASEAEMAEAVSCASLLGINNVFYRFKHFADKESYNKMPARIKMNIMMTPVLGKEFFELLSIAISAVNGCENCVKAHEASLIHLGTSESRIFEAVRLSAVVKGLSSVIW